MQPTKFERGLDRFTEWLDNKWLRLAIITSAVIFALIAIKNSDYTEATFWLVIILLNRPNPAPVIIYATHHDQDA